MNRLLNALTVTAIALCIWIFIPQPGFADTWTTRNNICRIALAQVGKPYSMDNNLRLGPTAFDCSGLVYYSYANAGITLNNTMADWVAYPIDPTEIMPGDLVYMGYETRPGYDFPTGHHVGIYVGDGCVVEAKGTDWGVVKTRMDDSQWTWCGRVPALTFSDGDMPVVGDFNGDKKDDIGVFRPGTNPSWFFNNSTGAGIDSYTKPLNWGWDNAVPVIGDFDGDGKDDIGMFRKDAYPNWEFRLSSGEGFSAQISTLSWGNTSGDTPVVGDFNGDGRDDIALHRYGYASSWFIKYSTGTPGVINWSSSDISFDWGQSNDVPVVGDFNGDGKDDLGVFRHGVSTNWIFRLSNGSGFSDEELTLQWGNSTNEIPLIGDFDGDGKDDIGLYRRDSVPIWFFRKSNGAGFDEQTYSFTWGNRFGDIPVIGDFDGDGKTDIGINRFGSYPNWFFRLSTGNALNGVIHSAVWGNPTGDTPLVGDFDGDTKTDTAIYRPQNSSWFVRCSAGTDFSPGASWATVWGNPLTETPLVGDFDGDGKSDIAIYRYGSYPNWFFKLSTGASFAAASTPLTWGNPGGDTPIVGDFNGDGKDDIAIYRTGGYPNWFVRINASSGPGDIAWGATQAVSWGNPGGDTPIVGNFNGDINPATGKQIDDIGIYRSNGFPNWYVLLSKTDNSGLGNPLDQNSVRSTAWGNPGDLPLVGDYNGDGVSDLCLFRRGGALNWLFKLGTSAGFGTVSSSFAWATPSNVIPLAGDVNGDHLTDVIMYNSGSEPNWVVKLLDIPHGNTVWDNDALWTYSLGNSGTQESYAWYLFEIADELSYLRCSRL